MAVNDSFASSTDGLADTNTLTLDGSGAGTNAANITELGGTGDCEIYRDMDPAGDSSWAVTVQIDSVSGEWHSQGNDLLISQSQGIRLRIKNVNSSSIDVYAGGFEVDN